MFFLIRSWKLKNDQIGNIRSEEIGVMKKNLYILYIGKYIHLVIVHVVNISYKISELTHLH